jgi:hypothetical protein
VLNISSNTELEPQNMLYYSCLGFFVFEAGALPYLTRSILMLMLIIKHGLAKDGFFGGRQY